jgi:hypothetical protein
VSPLPPELLVIAPLSLAAGIDLYLTLLFIGASPTLGLWDRPLPGILADLDSPSVLIMVGTMYLLEFAAERHPSSALVWNAFHAVIRPVSGALLALLVLSGQPTPLVAAGTLVGSVVASVAHFVRTGGAVSRWLGGHQHPSVLLVSMLEDALVLGLVALALDLPGWAAVATVLLALAALPRAGRDARAFAFAISLAFGRAFRMLYERRWKGPAELPSWVRRSLEDDDVLAPGGALRGFPVGAIGLPGLHGLVYGWLLVRGGSPVFVYRRGDDVRRLELGPRHANAVARTGFYTRVDVRTPDNGAGYLLFGRTGPGLASLRAEFLRP